MSNNGFSISEEAWEKMSSNEKLRIIYDTVQAMNQRLKKCERWNKLFSFIGGIVGGAASMLGIKLGGG